MNRSIAYINRETEREKLDRENNERNEREKTDASRMQQQQPNGHRSGAPVVDADLLERVKQRKEEEEKRALECRMAAAKKLQELEQKIKQKKEMSAENENEAMSAPASSATAFPAKVEANDPPRSNDRYMNRSDDGSSSGKIRDSKDSREYGSQRYESKFDRDARDPRDVRDPRDARDARGPANAGDAFFNKPYQSNLPPRFQKQRDQQDRHSYKSEPPHRPGPPRDQIRRPNQSMPQPHIMKRSVDDTRDSNSPGYYKASGSGPYSTHSKTSSSGLCESEDDDRVSSGRESISRSSVGERPSHLARSTSDSSQPEIKEKIGSWAEEMELDVKPLPQRQISSTSSTSANEDIQPKQILQRVRKVSIESRSDKEKSEEREILSLNTSIKSLNQSQEDVAKQQFGTSPNLIEAPKSWGDSAPTTPEIARKSIENLSDSSSMTAKTADIDKKQLESVLENESIAAQAEHGETKPDDKLNVSPSKPIRSYGSHPKDTYNSDDGKHGKRINPPRGIRNDRGGSSRNYGGNSSYRGGSSWNNRRNRSNRYNEYSESDGSDDEYHGHGNRHGRDDRYKHDSNRRDAPQSHSSSKDVFVPRGEPSRRGRGG